MYICKEKKESDNGMKRTNERRMYMPDERQIMPDSDRSCWQTTCILRLIPHLFLICTFFYCPVVDDESGESGLRNSNYRFRIGETLTFDLSRQHDGSRGKCGNNKIYFLWQARVCRDEILFSFLRSLRKQQKQQHQRRR